MVSQPSSHQTNIGVSFGWELDWESLTHSHQLLAQEGEKVTIRQTVLKMPRTAGHEYQEARHWWDWFGGGRQHTVAWPGLAEVMMQSTSQSVCLPICISSWHFSFVVVFLFIY